MIYGFYACLSRNRIILFVSNIFKMRDFDRLFILITQGKTE